MAERRAEETEPTFAVEMGPEGVVRLIATAGGKTFPLRIPGGAAAPLGAALLAAGTYEHAGDFRPPEGASVETCLFPVQGYRIGPDQRGEVAVLGLELLGGTRLAFQLNAASARDCGAKLAALAALLERAEG